MNILHPGGGFASDLGSPLLCSSFENGHVLLAKSDGQHCLLGVFGRREDEGIVRWGGSNDVILFGV